MRIMLYLVFFAFLLYGCSETANGGNENLSYSNADLNLAQQRLENCSKNVLANWLFIDSASAGQDYSGNNLNASIELGHVVIKDSSFIFDGATGLSISDSDLLKRNNFAVEMQVWPESSDSIQTLLAFGADGDKDAWMVRLEEGQLVFLIKNVLLADKWQPFNLTKPISKNDWTTIRMERIDSLLALYLDGSLVMGIESNFDLDIEGRLKIGFDPSGSTVKNFFKGKINFVRFEKIEDVQNPPILVLDSIEKEIDSNWIAAWEFNNSSNLGFDFSGKGHQADLGEGSIKGDSDHLILNGSSGLKVNLASDFQINEFVVETKVYSTSFGVMDNIIATEPPGRYGDGWILRIENGILKFLARDASWNTDWKEWSVDSLSLNKWYDIRVERSTDSLQILLNNEIAVKTSLDGDIGQLGYDWGIGYDAMNQAFHGRYFKGKIDYIRFGLFKGFSTPIAIKDTLKKDSIYLGRLLAAWEFNDTADIGFDYTNNGNSLVAGVGTPSLIDSVLLLDGASGLFLPASDSLGLNEFAVEARVYPTGFSSMMNIITTEPPGAYGDGWILRLENDSLYFLIRDTENDDDWTKYNISLIEKNKWSVIRVECFQDSVKAFYNGNQVLSESYLGDVSDLTYQWGLGYDAVNQAIHDRYFIGEIDYIRYYGL